MALYCLIVVKAMDPQRGAAEPMLLTPSFRSPTTPPLPDSLRARCLPRSYVPHWSGTDFMSLSLSCPQPSFPFSESQLSHKLFGQVTGSVTISIDLPTTCSF